MIHGTLTVFTRSLTTVIALNVNFWDLHVSTLWLHGLAVFSYRISISCTARIIKPSNAIAPVITQKLGPSLDEHPFFLRFTVLGQLFFGICDLFTSVLGQHNCAWPFWQHFVAAMAHKRLDSGRNGLKQCLLLGDDFVEGLQFIGKAARKLALAKLIISFGNSGSVERE